MIWGIIIIITGILCNINLLQCLIYKSIVQLCQPNILIPLSALCQRPLTPMVKNTIRHRNIQCSMTVGLAHNYIIVHNYMIYIAICMYLFVLWGHNIDPGIILYNQVHLFRNTQGNLVVFVSICLIWKQYILQSNIFQNHGCMLDWKFFMAKLFVQF